MNFLTSSEVYLDHTARSRGFLGFWIVQQSLPIRGGNFPPIAVIEFGKNKASRGSKPAAAYIHDKSLEMQLFKTPKQSSASAPQTRAWTEGGAGTSCPGRRRRPSRRPRSSSPTVFMELCFVVGVVPHSSPRPCKEPHHRAMCWAAAACQIPQNLCPGPNRTPGRLDVWPSGLCCALRLETVVFSSVANVYF